MTSHVVVIRAWPRVGFVAGQRSRLPVPRLQWCGKLPLSRIGNKRRIGSREVGFPQEPNQVQSTSSKVRVSLLGRERGPLEFDIDLHCGFARNDSSPSLSSGIGKRSRQLFALAARKARAEPAPKHRFDTSQVRTNLAFFSNSSRLRYRRDVRMRKSFDGSWQE